VHAHLTTIQAAEDMRRGDVAAAGQVLTEGMDAYRQVVDLPDDQLAERDEWGRLVQLRSAVDRADAEIAARAREEAQNALDRDGVGAVTVPGTPPPVQTSPTGYAGSAAGSYGGAAAPAAAPPAPESYDWSDEESQQILEVHSRAYGDLYGD
jgi:hypothetical protein